MKDVSKPTATFALVGRILLALLFLGSGFNKLATPAATQGYIASVGVAMPLAAYLVAVVVEVGGGLMLLAWYRARIAALFLAAFTAAAAALFHSNMADPNQMIHAMKNLAIIDGLLQVVAFGAGALSIDQRRAKAVQRASVA